VESQEVERLKYRRQFLLSPQKVICPFLNNSLEIKDYFLYTHIDLEVTRFEEEGVQLILLGEIYDYENISSNEDILQKLVNKDFDVFLESLSKYTGRYVIIYSKQKTMFLVHDAMAARKIYYFKNNEKSWFASHVFLLARLLNLSPTQDEDKLSFYNSRNFIDLNSSNIGDLTRFDQIHQLLPNHFFNVVENNIVRFWPNQEIKPTPLKQTAELCAYIIKGFMKSIASRNDVMLPITAGKDSRMLLAGSKEINEEVFYYINKMEDMDEKNPDIQTSSKLMLRLNQKFNVIKTNINVDHDFEDVYFFNHPYASKIFLPVIYNYYLNYAKKINLPGNIASSGLEHFKITHKEWTAEMLVSLYNLDKFKFALKYYKKWIGDVRNLCERNNIGIVDLFYWEERLANWGTQLQIEKDIAQEEINLFNSRELISLFLSVGRKNIMPPSSKLQIMIIQLLWSDALKVPINPSLNMTLIKILNKLHLLNLARKLIRLKIRRHIRNSD
jgi:hypothetical protein